MRDDAQSNMLFKATVLGICVSLGAVMLVAFYSMTTTLEPEWGWPRLSNKEAALRGALALGPVAGWIYGLLLARQSRRSCKKH